MTTIATTTPYFVDLTSEYVYPSMRNQAFPVLQLSQV